MRDRVIRHTFVIKNLESIPSPFDWEPRFVAPKPYTTDRARDEWDEEVHQFITESELRAMDGNR